MAFENLKISAEEINSLNVKSAADSYNNNSPRDNKNIFDKLPEHIAEKHNAMVEWLTKRGQPVQSGDILQMRIGASGDLQISADGVQWLNVADKALEGKADKDNSYTKDQLYTKEETDTKLDKKAEADKVYTKEETDKVIGDKMKEIGAGDMTKAVYDTDDDGMVDKAKTAETANSSIQSKAADNGIFEYTHSKNGTVHNLQGSGEYIAFYPTADWNPGDTLTINGQVVNCRNEKSERVENEELFKYAGFTVCYHRYGECFFKMGGAGMNFKIVGGTTQPASPKENTIWVNTNVTIHDYIFSSDEPSVKSSNKNLIVMDGKTTTINGITFTVNNDKSITINGTSTARTEFRLQSHHLNDVLNAGRKYTFNNTLNGNIAMGIHERKANDGVWIKNLSQVYGGGQTFTYPGPTEPGNEFYAYIYISSGKTISNVTVYPQLEEGTTPTSYVTGNGLGFVWIKTGVSSYTELNVLKKDKGRLMHKLEGCFIYRNTTDKWVNKGLQIYMNGGWRTGETYLLENGTASGIAGGFNILTPNNVPSRNDDFTLSGTGLKNDNSNENVLNSTGTVNKFNVTGYKTLYVEYTVSGVSKEYWFAFGLSANRNVYWSNYNSFSSQPWAAYNSYNKKPVGTYTDAIDISALQGEHYFNACLLISGDYATCTLNITKIWMV